MRRGLLFLILISTVLIIVACGTDNTNNEKEPIKSDEDVVNVEENEPVEEDEKNSTDEDKSENNQQDEEDTSENTEVADGQNLITETGVYNGQADPHTIEIETTDGPAAFQLSMEARDDIEDLTEGGKVSYTYYDNGEQLVIESIQPTE